LLLLTNWVTRAERSRANAFLILGNPVTVLWMSVITGYLIQDFGWQKTFVVEGLPAVLWAVVWVMLIRDKPSEARWIASGEAAAVEHEITQEQVSLAPVAAVRQAFVRGDVLLLSAQYFFWSLGVYGFVLWLPTIVKQGTALSMGRTGLLSAVPYLAAVVLMIVVAAISDRSQSRRAIVWPFLLAAGLALFGSFVLAPHSFWLAFTFLVVGGGCMYAPYGPFFAIVPERLPRNVTAEVMALINSCGALGGFMGSYCVGFLQSTTGNSRAGFLLMSISLIVSALLILCLPAKVAGMDQR
jgi:sugar phosphate permease